MNMFRLRIFRRRDILIRYSFSYIGRFSAIPVQMHTVQHYLSCFLFQRVRQGFQDRAAVFSGDCADGSQEAVQRAGAAGHDVPEGGVNGMGGPGRVFRPIRSARSCLTLFYTRRL